MGMALSAYGASIPSMPGVEEARQRINEHRSAPPSCEYLSKAQLAERSPEMEISDVP